MRDVLVRLQSLERAMKFSFGCAHVWRQRALCTAAAAPPPAPATHAKPGELYTLPKLVHSNPVLQQSTSTMTVLSNGEENRLETGMS